MFRGFIHSQQLWPHRVPITLGALVALALSGVACVEGDAQATSEAERIETARAAWDQRYADWLARLDLSQLDLRALPRNESMASYMPPREDLDSALAAADLVVVAEVLSITPRHHGMVTELRVETAIKGEGGETIEYHSGNSFEPDENGNVYIVESTSAAPTIFPGDRVLLFLMTYKTGYGPQPFTGFYHLVDGKVAPLPLNPFGDLLAGKSEAEAVEFLRAAVADAP